MTGLQGKPRVIPGIVLAAGILSAALAVRYASTAPGPARVSPEDARLQRALDGLGDATSEAASRLESRVAEARSRLGFSRDVGSWFDEWSGNWTVLARSSESYPGLEVRHYALSYNHPVLGSWPGIVGTIGTLCARPGLSVDSLCLEAGPEGSDAFVEAQLTLTVRLRP
jgi:hypothetical protein